MYKNLFFDFDGTLFNGYPRMLQAMQKALKEIRNLDISYDELFLLAMVSLGHLGKELEITEEEWARYAYYFKNDDTLPPFKPYDGTVELFEFLKNNGYKCYIYTNRSIETINYMKQFDLDKYISGYVCSAKKPNPLLLDQMIERDALEKRECLVVGDRTLDLEGAIASSIDSYAIHSYKKEPLATYQGDDFEDLISFLLINNID